MCATARHSYILTGWFYSLAAILDLFDGMAARRFKQTSAFGAVLDMVVFLAQYRSR
jgi:CDP-diacylglycerol--inositol 3-phosphatidyltransferase